MSSTANIQKFLMPPDEGGAYTDERLAALLAHAQDGKLGFGSCCCLIGVPTADHTLQLAPGIARLEMAGVDVRHYATLNRRLGTLNELAETEFMLLAHFDPERRERLIPLIVAEMDRREKKHEPEEEISDVKAEIEVYRNR